MKRVLLLAATTGYQMQSFANAARKLGIELSLATDRCHILDDPWRDGAIAVRFDDSGPSVQAICDAGERTPVSGLVAVADRPVILAARAAAQLGLEWHPEPAVVACRNKHRMRQLFATAGLPVPAHAVSPLSAGPEALGAGAGYPCVLKPLGLSASRGVIRINNPEEFAPAFERIRRILDQPEIRRLGESWNRDVQVEQYIPGREFALEGVMTRGELITLAIFDKPDPLEGPFFEETIYVTPSRQPEPVRRAIVDTCRRAAAALGLWHGPVHAEMRVNERGVWMLEIAPRPIGGLCARSLRFRASGHDLPLSLEEVLLLHAIGRMPRDLAPATEASGVMMIPVPAPGVLQSVSGMDRAGAVPGVEEIVITARRGERLVPLPEGASYFGFIFASGNDAAFVESALREAHRRLEFEVLAGLPVVSSR
ncbi:MAG TPA: ATP-grasp domain-containing protein [Bryobacteraceae bacterium]|nr:ATP-grasp domain-containing protein [Bryobacteraceae bacterium]